jgi:hypothetical protein
VPPIAHGALNDVASTAGFMARLPRSVSRARADPRERWRRAQSCLPG